MLHLIEREQISLLIMKEWGNILRSYNNAMQLFNATFQIENTSILKSTVHKTIKYFEETGTVKSCPKTERPATAINHEKLHVFLCEEFTYFLHS